MRRAPVDAVGTGSTHEAEVWAAGSRREVRETGRVVLREPMWSLSGSCCAIQIGEVGALKCGLCAQPGATGGFLHLSGKTPQNIGSKLGSFVFAFFSVVVVVRFRLAKLAH